MSPYPHHNPRRSLPIGSPWLAAPNPPVLAPSAGGRFCSGKRASLPAPRPFPVIQKVVASMAHLQEEKLRLQEELLALQEKLAARKSEELAVSVQLQGQVWHGWGCGGHDLGFQLQVTTRWSAGFLVLLRAAAEAAPLARDAAGAWVSSRALLWSAHMVGNDPGVRSFSAASVAAQRLAKQRCAFLAVLALCFACNACSP